MPFQFDTINALILRNKGRVAVDAGTGHQPDASLDAIEIEFANIGYALSTRLRQRLRTLDGQDLAAFRDQIAQALLNRVGGNRQFVPLFRSFPDAIPDDTADLWRRKVLVHYLQGEGQPCLFCGTSGSTHVLNPCRHVVCDACFDGSNYSACPVCEHAIDAGSPFILPGSELAPPKQKVVFQRIDLCEAPQSEARALFAAMCARKQAMSVADAADLVVLVRALGLTLLEWLPPEVPVRENVAWIFGTLLQSGSAEIVMAAAAPYIGTATDIARLIAAYSGADPSLQATPVIRQYTVLEPATIKRLLGLMNAPPVERTMYRHVQIHRFKVGRMARPLRRALLAFLENLHPISLTEDMLRHRSHWVWLGEFLHPGEYAKRFPQVAQAFAQVRKKAPDGTPAPPFQTYYARLERTFIGQDTEAMMRLLGQRPGELARRFDHALRIAGHDSAALEKVLGVFVQHAPALSSPVLLTLRALLPTRTKPGSTRIFWPKGKTAQGIFEQDLRPALPAAAVATALGAIDAALLTRCAAQPPMDTAIIDVALKDIIAPFNERTASRSAIQLPRGSSMPLTLGRTARLFLHWCEPEKGGHETDLDLSVGFYDANWQYRGVCSYYQLKFVGAGGDVIATSAGDLRDAPFPHGASEFIDVDCAKALAQGLRYAVMVVNNYAGMPFGELEHAFAGLMLRDDVQGQHFDPRAVDMKFDLQGNNGIFLPMVLDMVENKIHWLDVFSRGGFEFNNAANSNGAITAICPAMIAYFASGVRTSMYELALLHAAARSQRVILRGEGLLAISRRPGEDHGAFLARLIACDAADLEALDSLPSGPVLAALVDGDIDVEQGSSVYVLKSGNTSGNLAAADLIV